MGANNMVTAEHLADLLSVSTGRGIEECRLFLKALFEEVESGLLSDGQVEVTGLGVFVAGGRHDNPVSFLPAPEIATVVNGPFEVFAPVELMDDELIEPLEPQSEDLSEELSPAPVEPTTAEPNSDNEIPLPISEPDDEHVEMVSEEVFPEVAFPVDKVEAPATDAANVGDAPVNINTIEDEGAPSEESRQNHLELCRRALKRRPSRCKMIVWMIVMFILGIAIGIFAGYIFYPKISAFFAAPLGTQVEVIAHEATAPTAVTPAPAHAVLTDTVVAAVDTTVVAAQDTVVAPEEPVTPVREPRYDKVTSRVYLATLGRKYYGRGEYWVYIYEANDLKHPDRIRPGTKLRIPYPDELPFTGDSSADLRAAKKKAREIYARYKR